MFADFIDIIKSFKKTLNSKDKSKNQRYRNWENQKAQKQKPSFIK